MKILVDILISSLAVFVTAKLLPGVRVDGLTGAFVVAIVLGVVAGVLGPVLLQLSVPLNTLTLGLFTFVIIGLLVMFTDYLVPSFHVANFWWALAFALIQGILNSFLHTLQYS